MRNGRPLERQQMETCVKFRQRRRWTSLNSAPRENSASVIQGIRSAASPIWRSDRPSVVAFSASATNQSAPWCPQLLPWRTDFLPGGIKRPLQRFEFSRRQIRQRFRPFKGCRQSSLGWNQPLNHRRKGVSPAIFPGSQAGIGLFRNGNGFHTGHRIQSLSTKQESGRGR